jgi:acetolactate synthase-1/2/3 large subunit
MGARATKVTAAKEFAPALREAFAARTPAVIDVDVNLELQGYRSIRYPYPSNFHQTWTPGPDTATR